MSYIPTKENVKEELYNPPPSQKEKKEKEKNHRSTPYVGAISWSFGLYLPLKKMVADRDIPRWLDDLERPVNLQILPELADDQRRQLKDWRIVFRGWITDMNVPDTAQFPLGISWRTRMP